MVKTRIVPLQPALILDVDKRYLIVTDLHIGFESKFVRNEIFVGKNTIVNESISQLLEIINSVKPDSLILLGDVKSSIKTISKYEWDSVPHFFNVMKENTDVILIPGNHDSNIQKLIPEEVTFASPKGMIIENVLLTHGHTLPSENFSHISKIIMGHVHPVFF